MSGCTLMKAGGTTGKFEEDRELTSNPLLALRAVGQSIWREFHPPRDVRVGGTPALIDKDGLCGMTANSSTFEKAIDRGHDNDEAVRVQAGERRHWRSWPIFRRSPR